METMQTSACNHPQNRREHYRYGCYKCWECNNIIVESTYYSNSKPFTEEEQKVMELITHTHNEYVKLPVTHPSDRQDWVNAIHVLQRLMGQRILRREHPEYFVSYPEQ